MAQLSRHLNGKACVLLLWSNLIDIGELYFYAFPFLSCSQYFLQRLSYGVFMFVWPHSVKKLKPTKQSLDNFDNVAPIANSIPSPAASQMSNMSSPSKFIRIISGGRDRGRKAKALKVSVGQPGSGSPWSLFEEQALVVLVHDMGPNWELVSDAINSTREGFRSYDLTRMT
ncbi:hypothetical protein JHK82_050667 [Glycine max]|nr:hypothetical protein JHK82_050667 [Glycine max]